VTAAAVRPVGPTTCARAGDASRAPKPVNLTRAGSTVALATLGGKTLAYVADEDDKAVHVFDVDAQKDIAATPLGAKPAQLLFLPDGRLVVTLRDRSQVAVLEPGPDASKPMDMRCAVDADAEPFGVALAPDDSELLVTTAWGRSLISYDAKSPTLSRQWQVARSSSPTTAAAPSCRRRWAGR
jgi:DNA-binding beta-propeller fold protein YncE